ncbi:hypothetical protein HDU79_010582 [Rhizoclosmatium sp. JEL0117]|nr:hypothetical protein HDU79_010582 [Rhizoclosmatium sp. JEL0117]
MTVLSRKGRAQKVVALFNLQKSMLAVTRESYWMVMQAYQISTNRMGKSLVWYHRMLQDESIPRPGIRIFRLLLKGYLFTGDRDLDSAVSCLLEYERLNNVPADMTMYSTLLQQLNVDSRSNDVKWLFHRMLAWKLEPSLKAWNQYILSFKKDGSFDEESLLQIMAAQGLDPDVGTYYSLMEVYASVNDLASAGRCCEQALGKGFILSTRMWHILLLSHLQSNDINGFDRNYNISLSEMNSDQYFQSLYMRRLMATGEVHSAMNTAKSMLSSGIYPRRFTYDILMKSLICHDRHDYAIKLFEQMQQAEVIGIHNTYHMVLMTQLRNLDFYENPKEEMHGYIQLNLVNARISTELKSRVSFPQTV